MTVSSDNYTPTQYVGNGVAVDFSTVWAFQLVSDIIVQRTTISTGNTEDVTNIVTITGGDGSPGTVTFPSAPTSDQRITISRAVPYTQTSDYVENERFLAENLEDSLDKLTYLAQQNKSTSERALSFDDTIPGITEASIGAPVDNTVLKFQGTTGVIVSGPTETEIENAEANAQAAAASATSASASAQDAADSAASINLPTIDPGDAGNLLKVNPAEDGYDFISAVGTSELADDSVTLNKMSSGTSGNLISFDASGNPAYVATGTSGQVLTSAGAGLPPTFQNADAGLQSVQIFTSSGTWTNPGGINRVLVEVQGAGGGGRGTTTDGSAGGSSSFGAFVTAFGGSGGQSTVGGVGGSASAGFIVPGSQGGIRVGGASSAGIGGSSFYGTGGNSGLAEGNGYGQGGASNNNTSGHGAGGAGGYSKTLVNNPGSSQTVTVGVGGAGGTGAAVGAPGANGFVVVWEYA